MKMNPVWLHTFRVLVETGHFTRTAEKLFMTQPGVSQHIQKLESACGFPLIKRNGKAFTLTMQGEKLYTYAQDIEDREQQMLMQLGADDPYSGTCRIACSGSSAIRLYARLLEEQQTYPGLRIHLQAAPYQSILTAIKDNQIDLGIVTEKPDTLGFEARNIGREAIAIIVPASRPQGAQALADYLFELGIVRHPDSDYYTNLYLRHSESDDLQAVPFNNIPTQSFVNQIHEILLPVSMGLGFTVLPRSVLDASVYNAALSVMGNIPLIEEPLYLVYRSDRDLPARIHTLIPVLQAQLGNV
ncbi:LysR family transcriptional regulator [Salinimonas sp. HHU 13199]|uniref:LysR family transcriptional regulator n=1 Tax=Salinimonas profundi TaxID=2729140 RepID=A0ABR8LHC5_9ALTE|nr:LysR family transcriptional regulator [Salinimonas profundi]MBD3585662.1 LysR family transcriptional regulator [Salinimonas profundi]